jgi:hypothetical protein
MHIAPACVGSREGSDHFGSYVHSLSLHFLERLFPGLEPITSWSQGNSFTATPGLPFKQFAQLKKSSPVHVAPTCAGSGEESDHFGSYVRSLSLHFCKRLFLGFELMISWSQGNSFTAAPGLPFKQFAQLKPTKWKELAFQYVNKLKRYQIDQGKWSKADKNSKTRIYNKII